MPLGAMKPEGASEAQQASWGRVGGGNALCIPLRLQPQRDPPHLPLLLFSLLCLEDQSGLKGALEGGGPGVVALQASQVLIG